MAHRRYKHRITRYTFKMGIHLHSNVFTNLPFPRKYMRAKYRFRRDKVSRKKGYRSSYGFRC